MKIKLFRGTLLFKRLISSFVVIVGYYPLQPLITKLTGLNFSLSVITMIAIAQSMTGIFQVYFKKYKMYQLIRCLVFTDLVIITSSILYGFKMLPEMWFTLMVSITFITQSILAGAFSIILNDYISKLYPDEYKEFLVSNGFLISLGKTLILILTLIVSHYYPITANLCLSVVIIAISIFAQYELYMELKSSLKVDGRL